MFLENIKSKLIDNRNLKLWNLINLEFKVEIKFSDCNEYSVYSIDKNVTFYVVENDLNADSFTHELLHVYFRIKECFVGAALRQTLSQSNILLKIYSNELLEHISNCLEHLKMFKIYSEMGYENVKFLLDFDIHKCSNEKINSLKKKYISQKKIIPEYVDLFIGNFFAMKCDPNLNFDYSIQLKQLEKIDPLLFKINNLFLENWGNYDFENGSILLDNYRDIVHDYYQNLVKWIKVNNKMF